MKLFSLVLMSALATATFVAHAEETWGEKAADKGHGAKRGVKKAGHRIQEEVCMEGAVGCTAKKAGHRIEEGADATRDGAKRLKNKVD